MRATLAPMLSAACQRLTRAGDRLRAIRAELLLALAIVGGWACVTWFAALLWRPAVWALSTGLLLLSLAGWRLLGTIARDGLYALTREDRRGA